jgi:hypothetical protein
MKEPTKRNRAGRAPTPPTEPDHRVCEQGPYTAPSRPRQMVNFTAATCWVCGTRVEARAGVYSCSRSRYRRGASQVAHRPDPAATGTMLERLASGCPAPPIVVILGPGQRAPRKVAA